MLNQTWVVIVHPVEDKRVRWSNLWSEISWFVNGRTRLSNGQAYGPFETQQDADEFVLVSLRSLKEDWAVVQVQEPAAYHAKPITREVEKP